MTDLNQVRWAQIALIAVSLVGDRAERIAAMTDLNQVRWAQIALIAVSGLDRTTWPFAGRDRPPNATGGDPPRFASVHDPDDMPPVDLETRWLSGANGREPRHVVGSGPKMQLGPLTPAQSPVLANRKAFANERDIDRRSGFFSSPHELGTLDDNRKKCC